MIPQLDISLIKQCLFNGIIGNFFYSISSFNKVYQYFWEVWSTVSNSPPRPFFMKKAKVLLADVMTKLEGNEEERGIEFKETFRFDTKRARLQKAGRMKEADDRKKGESKILHDIEKEVSIAVAAFANTDGGKLEIGKKENEEGVGEISEYFEKDKKQYKNWDEYTRAITESIQKFTDDKPFVSQIKLEPQNEKKFLKLHIPNATTPIFIHDDNKEEYYIRSMTARSQKLTKQNEIMKHCSRRFPDWKG